MKKSIIILLSAVISLSAVSCSEFLNESPKDSLTDKNAFTTAEDAEALINSCYDGIQKGFEEYYTWYYMVLSETLSDNAFSGGDDVDIINVFKRDITPLNQVIMKSWKSLYGGILRCNVAIKNVPLIQDPALDNESYEGITRRNEILGEAHFLRALHYYNLVRLWGDVPLVLTTGSTDPEDVNVFRKPKAEVITSILQDLETAASYLPAKRSTDAKTRGLASKGAVYALAAKTYAIAGTPENTDWASVRKYTKLVMDSEVYSLVDDFNYLYDGQHRNNGETILAVQYIGSGSPEGNYVPTLLLPPSMTDQNWRKYLTPSQDLIAAFDNAGDKVRKDATIVYEDINDLWYDEYYAQLVDGRWSTRSIPFPYKLRGFDRAGWDCSDLIYIFRYADIVLLNAEALTHLEGHAVAAADADFQKIRTRVGLLPLQANSDAQMIELILDERRLELAYEGERFNDLKRYGLLDATLDNLTWTEIIDNNSVTVSRDFPSHMSVLPIPQEERDRNPNLSQNEGYN